MKISLNNLKEKLKNFYNKIKNFEIKTNIYVFTIFYTIFITIIYNTKFFTAVYHINNRFLSVLLAFCIVIAVHNIFFTLIFQRKITKFFAILFLFINAGILYFMNTYNIAIDKIMLLNALETDINETLELLNIVFFTYIFFLAIVPSFIILKIKITYGNIFKEILYKILIIVVSLLVGLGLIFINYKDLSSTGRRNKSLKHILLPYNYIDGHWGLIRNKIRKNRKFIDITADVKKEDLKANNNKKNLIIFVVGEAARADNFSLNGYNKKTNEYLQNQDLIYFKNFYSCGTSTAVSVPCMFSSFNRVDYDASKIGVRSNLLDFLKKVDINVIWRENNSGCKGVCERIETDNFINGKNKKYCNSKECFDEVLVDDLQERINNLKSQNNFIVLHQKGSHGPAYYLRVPEKFQKFKPICETEYFSKCSNEEIVNAYDNTINYTSYVLNDIIEILKNNEKKYNVALIYVSDHGQSLGENGMYLHGAPYKFSPEQQRHIPFLLWFSKDFKKEFKIDENCLKNKINNELSHDNIFHSVLGLFKIKTIHYNNTLDIFNTCRTK